MPAADASDLRLPPQNLEIEQSILGAIMLENSALNTALELIAHDDFHRGAHRDIFLAMTDLSERNEVVDQLTLTDCLNTKGHLERVGGAAYVAELVQAVPSASNIRSHCKILRDKALLRGLIRVCTDVVAQGYDERAEPAALLEQSEREIFQLARGRMEKAFAPMKEIMRQGIELVARLSQKKERITGVPTGYGSIDRITAGLQPSDLIIVAGRPSMGKTSFALGIAEHAAIHAGLTVGVFSMEMSNGQLALRMLSSQALLDAHDLRTGQLQRREEWDALAAAANRLEQARIFIDDSGGLTVQQMRGKARRLKADQGLDLLIIDYLQLMQGRHDAESRQQEISDISRSLKALAKELDIPVIALSQLSRAVEARKPPIPVLADLRESGAIEQDADVVMFIYRAEEYDPQDEASHGKADILIRKHRNGPTGDATLHFVKKHAKFADEYQES